jgi:hypothetical protein
VKRFLYDKNFTVFFEERKIAVLIPKVFIVFHSSTYFNRVFFFVFRYQWMCKHMNGYKFKVQITLDFNSVLKNLRKKRKKNVYFNESYWWLNLLRGLPQHPVCISRAVLK